MFQLIEFQTKIDIGRIYIQDYVYYEIGIMNHIYTILDY